jgi:putative methylase
MRRKHLESALSSIQKDFPSPDVSFFFLYPLDENAPTTDDLLAIQYYSIIELDSRCSWFYIPSKPSILTLIYIILQPLSFLSYVLQVTLEQYPTSPHLAASVVLTALEHGHVGPGSSVVDLGCGTGMLTMAAALLKSDYVVAVDCDEQALEIAMENAQHLEIEHCIHFCLARLSSTGNRDTERPHLCKGKRNNKRNASANHHKQQISAQPVTRKLPLDSSNDGLPLRSKIVDTVLVNPPFGTKNNAGMDVRFLQTAVRLARRAVYSFHKTTTRAYLQKLVTDQWKLQFTVVAEMQFDIGQTYKFHKDKTRDIAVDLIRIDMDGNDDHDGEHQRVEQSEEEKMEEYDDALQYGDEVEDEL